MKANNFELRIGNYTWAVVFVDKNDERIRGCDGKTYYNDFEILIRNDLNKITTNIVIRHEVVHALLCTQGRWFQKKFDVEDVCEFISFRLEELKEIDELIFRNLIGELEK